MMEELAIKSEDKKLFDEAKNCSYMQRKQNENSKTFNDLAFASLYQVSECMTFCDIDHSAKPSAKQSLLIASIRHGRPLASITVESWESLYDRLRLTIETSWCHYSSTFNHFSIIFNSLEFRILDLPCGLVKLLRTFLTPQLLGPGKIRKYPSFNRAVLSNLMDCIFTIGFIPYILGMELISTIFLSLQLTFLLEIRLRVVVRCRDSSRPRIGFCLFVISIQKVEGKPKHNE